MIEWHRYLRLTIISVFTVGCVEPYPAPDIGENISIMVVDGFINASGSSATVKLTRAVALAENNGYPAEKGADVKIRSEKGDTFTLSEQDSGKYSAYGLTVDPSAKYQLAIRTRDNRNYFSDFVSVMRTPSIDSVTWRGEDEGVTILVNTHDDSDNSRYYKWDYTETWEYHAPFPSYYKYVNNTVVAKKQDEMIYTCYRTVPSTKIVVGSTVRLSDDVVRDFPLTYMESGSSRLSVMYSIIVRQRVIDEIEYDFFQDLQRVTESVGGLFDSQPYEILGNIHSEDPSIPVLGFFSAGFIDEKRIFLRYRDLPDYLQVTPYSYCKSDTVCAVFRPDLRCIMDLASLPDNTDLVASLFPNFPGYLIASPRCVDCRLQGGVLAKPEFWP